MPAFVDKLHATFVTSEPPMLLMSGVPHAEWLPPFAGTAQRCPGWQLMGRLTACVVDGPGDDTGFLVTAAVTSEEVEAQVRWLEAVDRAGGAVVVATTREAPWSEFRVESLTAQPGLRGGFVTVVR